MACCNPAAFSDSPRSYREHYYETGDGIADVLMPGYFAPAVALLAAGDVIRVRARSGARIDYRELLVVRADEGRVAIVPAHDAPPGPPVRRRFPKTAPREG